MLKRNIVHSLENMQQRGEFGRELYRGRGGQIIQKTGAQNFREGYQNRENQYRGTETGPGPMVVDGGGRRGDIKFVSTVEDLGIQLGIVKVKGRELEREEELIRETSYQKRTEVSKLPAALL